MTDERDAIAVGDTVDFETMGYGGRAAGRGVVERITAGDAQPFPFSVRVLCLRIAQAVVAPGRTVQLKRSEIEKTE